MASSDMMDSSVLTELVIRMHEFEKYGDANPEIPHVSDIDKYVFSRRKGSNYLSFTERER